LDSPEQGLLVVPIFSDILPQSGGTTIATDSIQVLARFLAQRPEGLHPDGTQGGGYLIPALVEQCQQFEELTGNAGDVALLHPLMLHRASANPSGRARFIQNGRLSLEEPLCFNRADPADYSLVELCVLRALGEAERLAGWEPNGPRENNDKSTDWGRVTPRPFRTEEEKVEQQAIITVEQEKLAVGVPSLPPACCASSDLSACVEKAQGHHTPKWAARDYMDIAGKGSHPNDKNGKSRSSVFLGRDGAGKERPKASERAAAKL